MTVRVVIATDMLVQRNRLRDTLESGGFDVVGEAGDGESAVRLAGSFRPHVLIFDLELSGTDPLDAIRRIRGAWPDIAVLVLAGFEEEALILEGLKAGGRGYLFKDAERESVLHTVERAARGELVLSPDMEQRLRGEDGG